VKVVPAEADRRILARWLMDNDFEPRLGHKFALREGGSDETVEW
jgi:hypothetical protein